MNGFILAKELYQSKVLSDLPNKNLSAKSWLNGASGNELMESNDRCNVNLSAFSHVSNIFN